MEAPIYRLEGVVKARSDDLEDFVGPLDLILFLLSKNKMEIKDIQISLLLGQYLEWMERRKSLDLEVASEFVTMASHLVYIKTRMLLSLDDEEARSEMEQLIASLEEHQNRENYDRIKSAAGGLEGRYRIGCDYLVKTPEPVQRGSALGCTQEKGDLLRAMQDLMGRVGNRLPPPVSAFEAIVGREPYPVTDKVLEILQRLKRFGVSRFRMLFRENRSRSEIVATFVAVLELCKARRVRLAGSGEDCTVTCIQDTDGPLPDVMADIY